MYDANPWKIDFGSNEWKFQVSEASTSGSQLYLPYPIIQIIFNILPNNKAGLVRQNGVMEWKNIWSTRKSDFDVCELILIGFQRKWRVLNGKHLHHTQSFPSLKKAVIDKNYSHPSWLFFSSNYVATDSF